MKWLVDTAFGTRTDLKWLNELLWSDLMWSALVWGGLQMSEYSTRTNMCHGIWFQQVLFCSIKLQKTYRFCPRQSDFRRSPWWKFASAVLNGDFNARISVPFLHLWCVMDRSKHSRARRAIFGSFSQKQNGGNVFFASDFTAKKSLKTQKQAVFCTF